MLLAEELLLLALDDETGRVRISEIDKGLAGAVLIELALLERVRVAEKGESVRAGRLVVRAGPAPAHPVLAAGLGVLADREGRRPERVLDVLVTAVVDVPDRRAARRRAREIAEGQWAAATTGT